MQCLIIFTIIMVPKGSQSITVMTFRLSASTSMMGVGKTGVGEQGIFTTHPLYQLVSEPDPRKIEKGLVPRLLISTHGIGRPCFGSQYFHVASFDAPSRDICGWGRVIWAHARLY